MVDLFFYREPEESKGKQEEDAAVENYADYSTAAIGGTDQWPNQITDSKCNDKGISPAIPAVPGVTWTPDAAPITSDGWDGAVEPPMHVATGVDIIPPGFEEQGQKDEWNSRERVSDHKTPADFLISISGRPVVIKLNSGVDYRALCLMNSRKTASTTCFTILGIKFSCYVYGRQGTKL